MAFPCIHDRWPHRMGLSRQAKLLYMLIRLLRVQPRGGGWGMGVRG